MDEATATTKVYVEQPIAPDHDAAALGWREVATGVSSGSWAVVLVFGLVFFYSRKPLACWMEKQLSLLDELKANLRQNSETLKAMADTDSRTTAILQGMQERDQKIDEFIVGIREENKESHRKTWETLARIEDKLGSPDR